jgi:hypothetical protein
MPETRKRALKAALLRDMTQVRALAPQLPIVKVADGVDDNWTFLKNAPGDIEVIDFFHACEHFYDALATAWGTTRARAEFPIWRDVLRDCTDGVVVIVSLLRKLRRAFPRRTKVRRALGYFVRNRRRMQYATTRARGLPIASGVVEAACKTVVASRMRRAGMRWSMAGGQALLTLRAAAAERQLHRPVSDNYIAPSVKRDAAGRPPFQQWKGGLHAPCEQRAGEEADGRDEQARSHRRCRDEGRHGPKDRAQIRRRWRVAVGDGRRAELENAARPVRRRLA